MGIEPIANLLSPVESVGLTPATAEFGPLKRGFCAQVAPKFAPQEHSILLVPREIFIVALG
jgi:hypothetical protein